MVYPDADWKKKVVSPEKVLKKIEPGSAIFIGTGSAEPRTLVKNLMHSDLPNLQDLELIQLVSFGDAIGLEALKSQKFRLKTFFAGWVASDKVTRGQVDLIPARFSQIANLINSGRVDVDIAFVQITPPDESGYCSLGLVVDVARAAMNRATMVIGEISDKVPRTMGDTHIHISEFDYLVESDQEPIFFPRWQSDETFDKIAQNVASVIENGSCIAYSLGPLFESLTKYLKDKKDLGVHSPFITDPLMDLIKSGAVSNRLKENFRGRCVVNYSIGTKELYEWLHMNPLIEFQGVDKVFDPLTIGRNDKFIYILPARKADLSGSIALHFGKGNVAAGPSEAMDFITAAQMSNGGRTIFALPCRNLKGESNIMLSVKNYPNEFPNRELVDMIVTEYGVAPLRGRTVRERAQALIDIAHPDDRHMLIEEAKENNILYTDQIYFFESGSTYPEEISTIETFKDGLEIRFRAIRPSDEEGMRKLFYRFSDKSVYYRYFSPIKTMPHSKMQEYVSVDFRKTMSIVGLVGDAGHGTVIAEARYVKHPHSNMADVAFVVDEQYAGKGIGSYLFKRLITLAKERCISGFTADVLASNKAMMKVFEKSPYPVKAELDGGIYELSIPFTDQKGRCSQTIQYGSPQD